MNTAVHVSFRIVIFLGYMPSSGLMDHMVVLGFPGGTSGKEPTCHCWRHETWVPTLSQEDPLEEGMVTHSSSLSWKIPMDKGTWRATVHRIEKSWT